MKFIFKTTLFFLFLIVLVLVIAYARGYRFDIQNKSLNSTGIIAITSYPKTAKIYINNQFKGVTDANFTLPSGNYQVEIKKDGYTNWKKSIKLKGELVVNIDALLYPINPSLSPLTNLGIIKAIPLESSNKIIIFSQSGIHLFEAIKKPLSFFPPLKTIAKIELFPKDIDLSKATVDISPDLKQAIIDNYLISLEEENQSIINLSLSETSKENLINAWEEQKLANFSKILETYPLEFRKIASDYFNIVSFSPNETKVLYQALKDVELPPMITPPLISTNQTQEKRELKKDYLYVYDKKEDKNYLISQSTNNHQLLTTSYIQWYFDSRHLVIEEDKKISIVDYDNENKQTIYSGPFEAGFFTTSSDGKIIILANLNPQANELPDLYLVGIR